MTSITAALIVRNEQHFLPGCLESLRGLVDEVVVVDTGSSDATVQIARAAGARVSHFAWTGDFAAARNAALDRVETAWVLYIDADERVSASPDGALGSVLDAALHAGGTVRFKPHPDYTRYLEPRLFRSDPAIRFRHAIHETVVPDLLRYAAAHHLAMAQTRVCIDHHGFTGDQMRKIARNLSLLEAEVASHPERSYCWHHLAETLALAGRGGDALAACRRGLAVEVRSRSPKACVDRRRLTQTYARLLIAAAEDATEVIARLLREDGDDWAVVYLHGCVLLERGDLDGALAIGRRLAGIDPDALDDGLVAYDKRLFGDRAWALVAAAHHRAGRRSDAARAFGEAWRRAPGETAYLAKATALGARPGAGTTP